MSTWTEVVTYIKTQLRPGVLGNTNVQKILNSVLAVIQQINAGDFTPSSDFVWNPQVSYAATIQPVLWQDQWLVSNIGANQGNVPISTSGVLHPSWRIIGSSAGSGIRIWEAIVYPNSLEVVYESGQLYYLNRGEVGVAPFVSVDFSVELSEGKWVAFLEISEHNQLEGIQGGLPDQRYHLTQEELLKLQRVTANTSSNAVITYGTVVFTSPISVTLELWEWLINGVEFTDPSETLATTGTPVTYPRPDLFVGLEDGTIVYRPSVTDAFGNPVYPIIASNEVVLAVVIRDPDGNNIVLNPNEFFESAFPEQLFQTAVQADTTGLYAKVWGATLVPNATYHIQFSYGAPSAESDWTLPTSARSGLLNLTLFCLSGIPITGIHFETVDGKSKAGDWRLIRSGDQVSLYHKSTNFWQRVYYRVILVAGSANKKQIFNRQVYAALPSGDQSFDSVPLAGGGADPNAVHYNAPDGKTALEKTQARNNIDAQKTIQGTKTEAYVATIVSGVETWTPSAGGGGGGSGGLVDLDTFPILKFDKNYRIVHDMAGPIQLSVQAVTPLAVVGNSCKLYIKANGVNKPTLTGDFTVIWDNWVNTAGFWNRFYAEWSPEGKVVLQIENAHQGTANDGSGLTQLTINFATDNQVLSHVITNSTEIVINSVGAQVGFSVTLYVKADGVNKPFWSSANSVVVYDDWLNTADVWNRIKLEWGAGNKAIVQIINT